MHKENIFDVATIGAGASGTLLASQFSRHAPHGARMALIGSGSRPGRGVAYETPWRSNLLNVPAGNMSAYPDDRDHFLRWLADHLPGSDSATFAPRGIYGEYLTGIITKALDSENVQLFEATVTSLSRHQGVWKAQLNNGEAVAAHAVVLAVGNALVPETPLDVSAITPHYRGNPWSADALEGLPRDAPVLLLGTGLTSVDVALALREAGHEGPIHAVSRHGRLYHGHQQYQPQPLAELPGEFRTPRTALRWVRESVNRLQQSGGDWRGVVDSLRPHTAMIWQRWSLKQRAAFLRHLRNAWDIHRHRMAPEVTAQLRQLLADGILTVHAGRLLRATTEGTAARITIRSAQRSAEVAIRAERVINCTGPSRNYTHTDIPLLANLREQGWLTPDQLRLGIETDYVGRLIAVDGIVSTTLYTIGPLRIPALLESIAIPEIRVQAEELAQLLVSSATGYSPHWIQTLGQYSGKP